MIIKYAPLPGFPNSTLMPMVPVVFMNKKSEFPTYALVDSGASMSVVSTVIAEELGINWMKIPTKTGLAVASTVRYHTTEIAAEIYDHKFNLEINIAEGLSAHHCILGQKDLFQRAKITFEAYKKQFEIIFRNYN